MARTVTLSEEMVSDVERYRERQETEIGKRVTWNQAFRDVMESVVSALLGDADVSRHA